MQHAVNTSFCFTRKLHVPDVVLEKAPEVNFPLFNILLSVLSDLATKQIKQIKIQATINLIMLTLRNPRFNFICDNKQEKNARE